MTEAAINKSSEPSLITLLLLVSFGSVAAVFYTPALPTIATYFAVSAADAQNTMTIFLVGYALGQLIYGPLTHRIGLKPALYSGIALTIFSALLCVIAAKLQNFSLFMIARLLMAFGACAGLKITFTLIGECYPHSKAARIFSYVTLAFAIMPGIGISIGGFLTQYIGWQSCFYFLCLYSVVIFLLATKLPNLDLPKDKNALRLSVIARHYLEQLHDKNLIIHALFMGCISAFIYLFATAGPFIAMHHLHLRPDVYGMLNLLPPAGMIIGSLISAHFAYQWGNQQALRYNLFFVGVGTLIMLVAFTMGWLHALTLFLPTMIINFGLVIGFARASAIATTKSTDKSYASALVNFINLGFTVVCVFILGLLPIEHATVLPLFFTVLIGLMLFIYYKMYHSSVRA